MNNGFDAMSSSDEGERRQEREREVLGDEIERMRELLGRDHPASDEESSAEEEEEEDSDEEAIDDCTGDYIWLKASSFAQYTLTCDHAPT